MTLTNLKNLVQAFVDGECSFSTYMGKEQYDYCVNDRYITNNIYLKRASFVQIMEVLYNLEYGEKHHIHKSSYNRVENEWIEWIDVK